MKAIITFALLLCASIAFAAGGVVVNGDLTMVKDPPTDPNRVIYFSNGTSQWYGTPWSYNNLDMFYNGGNVGIGTNTPAQKLSVAGTIESTIGGFKFPDGTTQASAASVGPIGDLAITGNLNLPTTTATTGIITSGANRLIHTFGTNNIFVGINAGNLTSSGYKNTAIGFNALTSNTTGYQNTAVGSNSLSANTTGYQNAANGQYALLWNTSGINNTASGYQTLSTNSTGSYNSATGGYTLYYNETGSFNTADGSYALLMNTTGNNNTALGYRAGYTATGSNANTTGHNNTFIGANSGPGASTQLTNAAAIGYNALVSQNNSLVLGGTGADAVNVGIGTQTPSQALDVLGTIKATSFQGDGSGLTNVTASSVPDGSITDAKLSGTISDSRFSANVDLLNAAQTISGAKTFSQPIGSTVSTGVAPLAISSTTMVSNLNAEMIGGQKLSDFDNRYATKQTYSRTTTLSAVDSAANVGRNSSITIGIDGLPIISYYDIANGDLKVTKCGNDACTAGNINTTVDSTGDVGFGTSITIGVDGLPVIAYHDVTNRDLKVAKCSNAACSNGNTITTVDSTGDVGRTPSITIGTDGLPVISYAEYLAEIATNYSDYNLKFIKCGNAACNAGNTITTLHSTDSAGVPSSVTISADGLPVISYHYSTSANIGYLSILKCGDAACNTGNIITTIDEHAEIKVGLNNSITIGTDGLPIISYYDTINQDFKVLKCGDAACSAGNTNTNVDSAGNVGMYTSITIGTDGLPVISYYDSTNQDLKVVKCGNVACSSGNAMTTVDSTGNVGQYTTSISIGADGLPVIAYYDATNGDLKVAKCSNQFCFNNWPRR